MTAPGQAYPDPEPYGIVLQIADTPGYKMVVARNMNARSSRKEAPNKINKYMTIKIKFYRFRGLLPNLLHHPQRGIR
jgi:hypothetical protein